MTDPLASLSAALTGRYVVARELGARGTDHEAGWSAEALPMLGEMHEARGDGAKAAGYDGRYAALLEGADSVLRPSP